jgi:serine/threonine protein kinase
MHCDLKPQNIFVQEEGENRISPVVGDLGISIVMGDKTRQGTEILGFSERWMPYEYIHAETVSTKTDVWSLGCLIFYVFSHGHLPWSKCKNGRDAIVRIHEKSDFFSWVEE